jgi:hypothetical protein
VPLIPLLKQVAKLVSPFNRNLHGAEEEVVGVGGAVVVLMVIMGCTMLCTMLCMVVVLVAVGADSLHGLVHKIGVVIVRVVVAVIKVKKCGFDLLKM